jgi:hypothetical protein
MQGDNFTTGNTGSRTTGQIHARAPSSNEETVLPAVRVRVVTARGGGPIPPGFVVLPNGRVERYALAPPIDWGMSTPPTHERTGITREQVAGLPLPPRGVVYGYPTATGLLAQHATITSDQFNGNDGIASAVPEQFNMNTDYPLLTRGMGGGPPDQNAANFAQRVESGQAFMPQKR